MAKKVKKIEKRQGKKTSQNKIEGIISITPKGTGYVDAPNITRDIEIDYKHLNTALHGDKVEVTVFKKSSGRARGEVVRVLSRAKTHFTGVLEKTKELYFVCPDDHRMYSDILIAEKFLGGAKVGQKVFTELFPWQDHRKAPEGKIVKVLGMPGDNNTEMASIAIERGFDSDFPPRVEKEAERLQARGITEKDLEGRKDIRGVTTITIDPLDAKDFDDAISLRILDADKYEVGIHIADVSYYVRPESEIDKEAEKRGTSVYLVDRTIPMLPEALSNDLCSLVPRQDRLAMSAIFELNSQGEVQSEWFGRTVINSDKRFAYEDAEKSIKNPKGEYHKELTILNKIAKNLTRERFKKGAIHLEQEEVKFVLDERGVPIKIVKKIRGDSNKLIEELMLLANKRVAMLFEKEKVGGFIYRVHDYPSKEKMADLSVFLQSLGYKVRFENGIIPSKEINRILGDIKDKDEQDTVSKAIVRSMAKAIYSVKNIGHYGLNFAHYTHFTSPIRRYPDLIVHRLLMEKLSGKSASQVRKSELFAIANKTSEQEKKATEAERSSIKYKQVEYMSSRIGQKFSGIISGINEWGIFVEEEETKAEGMVRVRDMDDDFYVFNEKTLELVGEKTKKRYRFGMHVKIKVNKVDLEKKTIDFILI